MRRVLSLSLTMTTSWLLVHSLGCHQKDSWPSLNDGGPISGAHIDVPTSTYPTSTPFETPSLGLPETLQKTQSKPVFGGDNSLEKYSHPTGKTGKSGGKSSKGKFKNSSPSEVVHVEEGTGGTLAGGDYGTFRPINAHEDDDGGHDSYCGNRELEADEQCDDGNLFNDDGCDNDCKLTNDNCTFYSSRYGTYVICQDEKTWQDAHAYCLALGPYDLVTINNDPENNYLTGLINPSYGSDDDDDDDDDDDGFNAWIGFNDLADEDNFVWSSGESSTYTNWGGDEPNNSGNEDCAEIYDNGWWNDGNCSNEMYFICEAIFEGPVDE